MKAIKTILIVDDEESLRNILRSELEKSGLAVLEAENGEIGLPLAFEYHPDCIVLDIIMPKMHGMSMLEKLQADAWGKTVPVIVLTNFAEDPRVVASAREGKCVLLSKSDAKLTQIIDTIKEKAG